MNKAFIPLGVFIALVALMAVGLGLDPKRVPSALIDKPVPEFALKQLMENETLTNKDMLGKVWILNVWASWCVSCRAEHDVIKKLASYKMVDIIGLNYKDEPGDARRWLFELGNPYTKSIIDYDGRTGIDFGVYGVPETFLIDKQGVIRYKHIGPVTNESLRDELLPEVRKLL
ncbi:MAG: DsbE family thiol:disulfide interchange protein [Gammaproteobacteria bacterium]|nr:DsbE family thiol:disulfide interchange protein [Gammaproteobacteria bacterium]